MKKAYLLLVTSIFAVQFSYAQWTQATSTIITTPNSVGIGTTNPTNGLLVVQGIITSETASSLPLGNNDGFNLFAGGFGYGDGARQTILWSQSGLSLARFGTEYNATRGQIDFVWRGQYNVGANTNESMRLTGAGNLLIGQTGQVNTVYKLDVKGNVRANQITVNTSGADFVFNPSYKLPTLTHLETFIKRNHHLPEVTSAKEMQTDGLNLGDNQTKLLQKWKS